MRNSELPQYCPNSHSSWENRWRKEIIHNYSKDRNLAKIHVLIIYQLTRINNKAEASEMEMLGKITLLSLISLVD